MEGSLEDAGHGMLAFDIETTGLNNRTHKITVAAVHGNGVSRVFNFITHPDLAEEFLCCLDSAESLCAFNGLRFDIPFIANFFNVPSSRYERWIMKLYDVFECCKLLHSSSCSLNALLHANGYSPKTSTGLQAVEWAKEGKWDELEEYCMADTKLTHAISVEHRGVLLPLSSGSHQILGRRVYDGVLVTAPA
jgi:hypothetical protein